MRAVPTNEILACVPHIIHCTRIRTTCKRTKINTHSHTQKKEMQTYSNKPAQAFHDPYGPKTRTQMHVLCTVRCTLCIICLYNTPIYTNKHTRTHTQTPCGRSGGIVNLAFPAFPSLALRRVHTHTYTQNTKELCNTVSHTHDSNWREKWVAQ